MNRNLIHHLLSHGSENLQKLSDTEFKSIAKAFKSTLKEAKEEAAAVISDSAAQWERISKEADTEVSKPKETVKTEKLKKTVISKG